MLHNSAVVISFSTYITIIAVQFKQYEIRSIYTEVSNIAKQILNTCHL